MILRLIDDVLGWAYNVKVEGIMKILAIGWLTFLALCVIGGLAYAASLGMYSLVIIVVVAAVLGCSIAWAIGRVVR